jgi:hypothetical protein
MITIEQLVEAHRACEWARNNLREIDVEHKDHNQSNVFYAGALKRKNEADARLAKLMAEASPELIREAQNVILGKRH